jgi:hypothetical protein
VRALCARRWRQEAAFESSLTLRVGTGTVARLLQRWRVGARATAPALFAVATEDHLVKVRLCISDAQVSSRKRQLFAMWTAPFGKGGMNFLQCWSVRPCVRPFDAAQCAAGHMPSAESGPDQ